MATGVDQIQGTARTEARGRGWGMLRGRGRELERSAGAGPSGTQGHVSPRDVGIRCADLLRNMKRNQAALIKIMHRGFKLMNIQHPASGWQLHSSPAQLGDCACVAGARLCRHTRAQPLARKDAEL